MYICNINYQNNYFKHFYFKVQSEVAILWFASILYLQFVDFPDCCTHPVPHPQLIPLSPLKITGWVCNFMLYNIYVLSFTCSLKKWHLHMYALSPSPESLSHYSNWPSNLPWCVYSYCSNILCLQCNTVHSICCQCCAFCLFYWVSLSMLLIPCILCQIV